MSDNRDPVLTSGSVDPPLADSSAETTVTNHVNAMTNSTEYINGVMPAPTLGEQGKQDSSENNEPKAKPKTFKITSVTMHPQKGASQDGRLSCGEDEESAVEDSLIQTDAEDSPAPLANITETIKRQERPDSASKPDPTSVNPSRFRLVKLPKTEPYTKGRWRISDTPEISDNNHKVTDATGDTVNNHHGGGPPVARHSDSGNSSRASSHHYVHGVDDPSKNPLLASNQPTASVSNHPLPSIQQSPIAQSALSQVTVTATGTDSGTPYHDPQLANTNYTKADHFSDANAHSSDLLAQSNITIGNSSDVAPAGAVGGQLTHTVLQGTQLPNAPGLHQQQHHQSTDQSTIVTQINTQAQSILTAAGATTSAAASAAGNIQQQQENLQQTGADGAAPTATARDNPALTATANNTTGGDGGAAMRPPEVQDVQRLATNLTELIESPADGDKPEDPDATASGVAIDNKIEQAMDLVKSHLMLAVREEVEDLKQQIKLLEAKNNQLDQENKLLRASASPETLALLSRMQNP